MLWPAAELDAAYSNILENSLNRGCTVLIVVAMEGDALCSASILIKLFERDNVKCRVDIVQNPFDLSKIFEELHVDWQDATAMKADTTSITSVVFLNCAGNLDLQKEIGDGFSSRFYYVADFRRKYHPENVTTRNEHVIVFEDLLSNTNEEILQPNKKQRTSDASNYEENQTQSSKDSESVASSLVNKINHEFSYFGHPTSHTLFQLSLQINRADETLFWLAVTGLCFHFMSQRISDEQYELLLQDLSSFSKLQASNTLSIVHDTKLFLHRHISLYTSLVFSRYLSVVYGCNKELSDKIYDPFTNSWIYKVAGTYQLNILLAKIGFSKDTCNEIATIEVRNNLCNALGKIEALDRINFPCCLRRLGYGEEISSKDSVHIIKALMRESKEDSLDFLLNDKTELLEEGISSAREDRRILLCVSQRIISNRQIKSAGDFRYTVLNNLVREESETLKHPYNFVEVGHFIMQHYRYRGKWKGLGFKPLVLALSYENDEFQHSTIYVAIEQINDNLVGNLKYRNAMIAAAKKINCSYTVLTFDLAAVEIYSAEQTLFLGALHDVIVEND